MDEITLAMAKAYTNKKLAEGGGNSGENLSIAKAYTDEKLETAKDYADEKLETAKDYADEKLETAKAYTDEKLSEVGGSGGGQGGSATPPLDLYAQVDVAGDIPAQIESYKDSSYKNKLNSEEIDNAVAEGRSIRVIVEVLMGGMKYTDVLLTPLYVMYGGGARAIVHTINPLAEGAFGTLAFAFDY